MAESRQVGPFARRLPAVSWCADAPTRAVSWRAGGLTRGAAALGALLFGGALACAGAAPTMNERYPEKKRPEPPISASDGKVLGANEQDPSDTLEGSLTNEHGAMRSPHAEEPAEAAHERLEQEECVKADEAALKAGPAGADKRRRPLCPPPAAPKD